MHTELFGYISGVLILLSFAPYLRDIFRHKTNPQRASWFIWSLLGVIALFSQLAKGASSSLWFTGLQVLGDLSIFILSIKHGIGGFAKKDIFALIGAGVALVIWYFTQEAAIALFIIIFIDGLGGALTILKSYAYPKTETSLTFVLTGVSGFFACLAVGSWNITLLAFPFYTCVISFMIVFAIHLGARKTLHP